MQQNKFLSIKLIEKLLSKFQDTTRQMIKKCFMQQMILKNYKAMKKLGMKKLLNNFRNLEMVFLTRNLLLQMNIVNHLLKL